MRAIFISSVAAGLCLSAAALAQPMPPPAAQYMMMAGQSDEFEVAAGKLAAQKAMSAEVKSFGSQMVTDHTKSTEMVKAAAKKSRLPVGAPPPMPADKKAMLAKLQAASGADFDKLYVSQQLAAHKEALALQSSYAQNGDNAELKMAAGKIVPVVKMHIGMLEKMPMKPM